MKTRTRPSRKEEEMIPALRAILTPKRARDIIRSFYGPGRSFTPPRLEAAARRVLGPNEATRIERAATLSRFQ